MRAMSDLGGKTVLVTGATAGIGRETALGLAKLGAHVVIVGRDEAKTKQVCDELRAASGNQKIDFLLADGHAKWVLPEKTCSMAGGTLGFPEANCAVHFHWGN